MGFSPTRNCFCKTITSTVANDAPVGRLTNTATVAADTEDPELENNSSTNHTDVELTADVSIVKTAYPTAVNPSDTLAFTLVITNLGPDTGDLVFFNKYGNRA